MSAASAIAQTDTAPGALSGPPRSDMLMDAFVVPDGEGGYWLTGTAGTFDGAGDVDYQYNRGAPLFHSKDAREWRTIGYAWDRVEHLDRTNNRPKLGIWMDWSAPGEEIDGLLAQATTSPKLYFLNDTWFLLCSMNRQNLLLQKSISGGPEGPFEDYAFLASRAPDASFFVDDDGTVYLVYAEGWIARMKPDLTAPAETPRPIQVYSPIPGAGRLTVGERGGIALFKRDGQYQLLAPRHQVREGHSSHDAVLWTADSVYGPYRDTGVALEGSGPVTVFQSADSRWIAVSALPTGEAGPRFIPLPPVK